MGLYEWVTYDEIVPVVAHSSGTRKYIALGVTSPPLAAGVKKEQYPRHTLFQDEDTVAVATSSGALYPSTATVRETRRVSDGGSIGVSEVNYETSASFRYLTVAYFDGGVFDTTWESWNYRYDDSIRKCYGGFAPEVTGSALTRIREQCYGGDALPWCLNYHDLNDYTGLGGQFFASCPSSPIAHPGNVAPVFMRNPMTLSPRTHLLPVGSCFGPSSSRYCSIKNVETVDEDVFLYYWENGTTLKLLHLPNYISGTFMPWWGLPPIVEYNSRVYVSVSPGAPAPSVTIKLILRQRILDDPFTGNISVLDTDVVAATTIAANGFSAHGTYDIHAYGYILSTASVGTVHIRCISYQYIAVAESAATLSGSTGIWHRHPPGSLTQNVTPKVFYHNSGGGEDELTNVTVGLVVDL